MDYNGANSHAVGRYLAHMADTCQLVELAARGDVAGLHATARKMADAGRAGDMAGGLHRLYAAITELYDGNSVKVIDTVALRDEDHTNYALATCLLLHHGIPGCCAEDDAYVIAMAARIVVATAQAVAGPAADLVLSWHHLAAAFNPPSRMVVPDPRPVPPEQM